jgi:hypothetical protein
MKTLPEAVFSAVFHKDNDSLLELSKSLMQFQGRTQPLLRHLRSWHWTQAVALRQKSGEASFSCRESTDPRMIARLAGSARQYDAQSNFHMRSVQVLNDLFETGDTAEKDALK